MKARHRVPIEWVRIVSTVVSRLMWKIVKGIPPAPERDRGYHDVERQARIWLESHVEASGHIGISPHARCPQAAERIRWRMTAARCVYPSSLRSVI